MVDDNLIRKYQNIGKLCKIKYSTLETNIGDSIVGICLGAEKMLSLTDEAGGKTRFLEIGPGNGELISRITNPFVEINLIGEKHHLDLIVKNNPDKTIHATDGWFPQDLEFDNKSKTGFDLIFASRVLHIGGIKTFTYMLESIYRHLRADGKVVIETTSPWSYYYQKFWKRFQADSSAEYYDVSKEEMLQHGLAECDVCLFTKEQVLTIFNKVGFRAVECEYFRMPAKKDDSIYDSMLCVTATK